MERQNNGYDCWSLSIRIPDFVVGRFVRDAGKFINAEDARGISVEDAIPFFPAQPKQIKDGLPVRDFCANLLQTAIRREQNLVGGDLRTDQSPLERMPPHQLTAGEI